MKHNPQKVIAYILAICGIILLLSTFFILDQKDVVELRALYGTILILMASLLQQQRSLDMYKVFTDKYEQIKEGENKTFTHRKVSYNITKLVKGNK